MDKALRFNDKKTRYDLLEPYAIEQVARVFTKGAEKYEPYNWIKGMEWSKMVASLKRHVAAFENGEDYDYDPNCPECQEGTCKSHTGLLHMAHAAWNCLGIVSYYKYYPQGDDRLINVLPKPIIGLDIDECICNWVQPWCDKFGYPIPEDWHFSYDNVLHFKEHFSKEELDTFYLALPPKVKPSDIPFDFSYYVTSRSVPVELTQKWIQMHGFPTVPVYSLGIGESKVDTVKQLGITHFIDDNYKTYCDLSREGVAAFLMTAKHNEKYPVGYRRIKDFNDFKERFL